MLMGCNINIEFLLDPAKAEMYCVKYAFKDEPKDQQLMRTLKAAVYGFHAPAWAANNEMCGLGSLVGTLLNAMVGKRYMGDWETAYTSQDIPLHGFTLSQRSLRLGGSCVIKDNEEDDDGAALEGCADDAKVTKLENDYHWYNNRPDEHTEQSWFYCTAYLTEQKYAMTPFEPKFVNFSPFINCVLPS